MPISISKLPEVTNVKDNSFMLITQDGTTKRTMCDQFVTEEEARLDEFSPTVITSKSMSKTGEGDNVDYSSSVYGAPMKDVVLKGKTMVNCIQEPSSQDVVLPYEFEDGQYVTINDTKESGALGVELKGQTLVNVLPSVNDDRFLIENSTTLERLKDGFLRVNAPHNGRWQIATNTIPIKPSTNYLLITEVKNNTVDGRITLANTTGFTTNSLTKVDIGFNGVLKQIITTRDVLEDYIFQGWLDSGTTGFVDIRNTLIEYQNGMENWDIPYFTGITSCKMPILSTVGKNLFNPTKMIIGDGNLYGYYKFKDNENINYTLSISDKDTSVDVSGIYLGMSKLGINASGGYNWVLNSGSIANTNTMSITTKFNYVSIYPNNIATLNKLTKRFNIQVEYGEVKTTYEPYKTSILSTNEDLELRGIGDVQDTLDLNTGKLTSYYGERIVTEDDSFSTTLLDGKCTCIVGNITDKISSYTSDNFLADKVPHGAPANTDFGIYQNLGNFVIYETGDDLEAFKSKVIGTKIYYRLAEPVNKAVDLKVVDQNGNVIPTLKSWNTTTHIYSEIPENTLYPILSHSNPSYPVILKPSTKYSIVANSYSNDHTNSAINFNLGGATTSTTVGNRVTTITTPSTLTSEELVMSGRGNKLNNVMVIEGDVAGDEPYFEGICDCKTPILSNLGKNLFDYKSYGGQDISIVEIENGLRVSTWATSLPFTHNLLPNTKYTSKSVVRVVEEQVGATDIGAGKIYIYNGTTYFLLFNPGGGEYTFKTPSDIKSYNRILFYAHGGGGSKVGVVDITNMQIEETSSATAYEPYKSNTTTFDQKDGKTIVLRSLPNGVCDTLNVETGEYVQRIGEVVLDGSWGVPSQELNGYFISYYGLNDVKKEDGGNVYCDKFASHGQIWAGGREGVSTFSNSTIWLSISSSKLETPDINGMKKWLSQNPTTVQYELATPIVSTIDVQGFPYAYKDGHVQLSSGSIEQSLTPKVEYNIATNRGGQITQNTKSLIRQGKLLNDIESKINQIIEATVNDGIMLMKLRNK
nr:MAG TPA: hypothetical protein [Caudoviricetes sp.]